MSLGLSVEAELAQQQQQQQPEPDGENTVDWIVGLVRTAPYVKLVSQACSDILLVGRQRGVRCAA